MKWIFIVAGLLILVIALIFIAGLLLPVSHTATVSSIIPMPATQAWTRLTDFSKYPEWRKNIKKVEVSSPDKWTETDDHNDKIPYKMDLLETGRKLRTEIVGDKLTFGGYWIIELKTVNNDTEITITEYGKVFNPIFRALSKFVFGHDATIKNYLKYLT